MEALISFDGAVVLWGCVGWTWACSHKAMFIHCIVKDFFKIQKTKTVVQFCLKEIAKISESFCSCLQPQEHWTELIFNSICAQHCTHL